MLDQSNSMKFGFVLPNRGPLSTREGLISLASQGESLGFDFMAVSDHVVVPRDISSTYPYTDSGEFPGGEFVGDCLEQLTTLAFIAGATSKAQLLTSVMVAPYRSAIHAGKVLATIDVLSKGRLLLGLGAGWMEEEFKALGLNTYELRGRVTDEYISAFKEMWTSKNPDFKGHHVSFCNISFEPKPTQKPHPPIWTGGESPAALRRAGRYADVWYPIGNNPKYRLQKPEKLYSYFERVKQNADESGRDPESISLAYAASWYDETKAHITQDGDRTILTGSFNQIASDIDQLKEVGVDYLLIDVLGFDLLSSSTGESKERMDAFYTEIISQVMN